MKNLIDEISNEIIKTFSKQKEDFIKEKFTEKGYGHLVESLEKTRFPKITISRCNGWDYYFADNGTKQGEFIVAIKDAEPNLTPGLHWDYHVNFSFDWQNQDYSPVKL